MRKRKWNDDPFTKKARQENYAARSVYKLGEIDTREKIFPGVKTILDLGASPGSWTQYCLEKLPHGRIVAVDIAPMRVSDPRLVFLHGSIEDVDISGALQGQKADMVLSDMAPNTSGIHDRDVALSFELAVFALENAKKFLRLNGLFIVKLFMGESFEDYHRLLKSEFAVVKLLRPESTRKHSREIFFIAKGFKGPKASTP